LLLLPPADGNLSDCNHDESNDINSLPRRLLSNDAELVLRSKEEENDASPPRKKAKHHNWVPEGPSTSKTFDATYKEYIENDIVCEWDAFSLLFTDSIWEFLAVETSSYMHENITAEEIKTVFGVVAASGICSQSRRRDYWSSSTVKRNQAISEAIGQKRFEHIFSHIHCCPVDSLPCQDKFQKVRPLVSKLNENFLQQAPSSSHYSVDETMVPYFGRHNCKQFMKGKPVKFGFKVWSLCTMFGYNLQIQPYPGPAEKPVTINGEYIDLGASGNIVAYFGKILRQLHPLKDPLTITMDNYFSSIELFDALKMLNIGATGTFRVNRLKGFPCELKKMGKATSRGDFVSFSETNSNTTVAVWNDNKAVAIGSTCASSYPVSTTSRYSRQESTRLDIQYPYIVSHYNKTMGGVDKSDSFVASHRSSIRGKKWYYPLIIYLFDLTIANSWILYRLSSETRMKTDLNSFKTAICENLLAFGSKGKRFSTAPVTSLRYDPNGHLINYAEKQGRCSQCSKNCNFKCLKCDVRLHPKDCFVLYHSKK